MQLTSGAMTFGGAGFFADATQQESAGVVFASGQKKVLSNLQNQIDSALNRGVAVVPGSGPSILPLKPSSDAYTTTYWGTESNWYPAGQPQNLFSLFLHTGTIDGKPIFTRPSSPASTNEGLPMGMAYGFAFDENPIQPAPANQAQVPSKFDPVPAGTATITITLGPWYAGS